MNGDLYVVCRNGDILKYSAKEAKIDFDLAGTPKSIVIDNTGTLIICSSLGVNIFIADLAH